MDERTSAERSSAERNLGAMRVEYDQFPDAPLDEASADPDPIAQFLAWFDQAVAAGVHEPNAMVVSTVGEGAMPSARIVLLKDVVDGAFRFFTNEHSRKGREIVANPYVALTFPWHAMQRSVRVEGIAAALSRASVADYFATRHRVGQLGAWASHQSEPVADRATLDAAYADMERRFADVESIPPPDEWGAFGVTPHTVEFWQGRWGRMHDRLVYRREPQGWRIQRLSP